MEIWMRSIKLYYYLKKYIIIIIIIIIIIVTTSVFLCFSILLFSLRFPLIKS